MATRLFVGSLSYSVTDDQLQDAFAQFGTVVSAKVIVDRDNNNRSKGFGFVEMSTDEEAQTAIKEMNGKDLGGRTIVVNEARPRENNERRSFNGGGDRHHNNEYSGGRQY